VHPFWEGVHACAEKFGPVVEIKRNLAPSGNATADFYSSRIANLLVGYAACMGLPDLSEAVESLSAAIVGRWDPEDFFEAYTAKVVNLDAPGEDQGEGEEDGIPF
jgi:hypothetical protein